MALFDARVWVHGISHKPTIHATGNGVLYYPREEVKGHALCATDGICPKVVTMWRRRLGGPKR